MSGNLSDLFNKGASISGEDLWWEDYTYNDSGYYDADNCCEGGDVCDLNEGIHFEAVFIPVLYSAAFVVGILGNGLLLGVLAKSRKNWSVTDTFILHLGVADVLLLLTLPLWTAQAAQVEGWAFGTPVCMITGAVFTINFYCGIFLLACISLDRYLSIVHATQMYSRKKPWVVQASCCAVWFFSLLLSIPDWMFLEAVLDDRRNKTECIRNYLKFSTKSVEKWRLTSRVLYHMVGFLLPSVILIFCYSCILWRLRCGTQGLQKQKAFRVIMAVVVVFFLCWTPYNITLMVETRHSDKNSDTCGVRSSLEKAKIVTSSIGYLHCSLNPILYAFVGVKFRRQLFNILRSLGCMLKTSVKFQSAVSSRRTSIWSESADTSNSMAI
ncbi:C-X-C chemokine receptor type 3-like [Seriola lalandi dorsalis]|uniref:C-X-C chemokine receptor type 3-like n=1 Tax=Seriola lalandi dorsalis TaxID=1841481 RepID=UPI000C6FB82B|nr:C-X-C chemokine receptor type 3-like [Seriola lalandi dorsalis]XP_056235702.1 C-X-C chemokine receptor type 3.1 [Seriola aureovittata]